MKLRQSLMIQKWIEILIGKKIPVRSSYFNDICYNKLQIDSNSDQTAT